MRQLLGDSFTKNLKASREIGRKEGEHRKSYKTFPPKEANTVDKDDTEQHRA